MELCTYCGEHCNGRCDAMAACGAIPPKLLKPYDNWRNPSTFTCETCMYYVPKGRGPSAMPELGRCRRHAPEAGGNGWPVVTVNDWCGDHKLKADAQ